MSDYHRRASLTMDPGPAMSSSFGGPTEWGAVNDEFAGLGSGKGFAASSPSRRSMTASSAPGGDRPFGGVGRYDAATMLPMHPRGLTPGIGPESELVQLGPRQPGIFQTGLGGLASLTELVPLVNEHDGLLHDAANAIGEGLDNILRAFGTAPFEGTVLNEYNAMSSSSEKLRYDAVIRQDPTNALRYMSQYLGQHAQEIASRQGVNQLVANMTVPSLDLSEWLSRNVFGLLMLPGSAVNRMAMSVVGHADAILNADPDTLDPELYERVKQVDRSSYQSRSEFADWLAQSPWRWNRQSGAAEDLFSFAFDILLDPLTYLSLGVGKVASIAGRAATASHATTLMRLTREGSLAKYAEWAASKGLARIAEEGGGSIWQHKHIREFYKEHGNSIIYEGADEALKGRSIKEIADESLTREQRYLINDENILDLKHKVDQVLGLYGMFGAMPLAGKALRAGAGGGLESAKLANRLRIGMAKAINKHYSDNFTNGWVSWFGVDTVRAVQEFAVEGAARQGVNDSLTAAIVNAEMAHIQRGLESNIRALDPDWRGAGRSPEDIVRERMSVPGKLAADGEEAAARTSEHWLGSSGLGAEYVEKGRSVFVQEMVSEFAMLTGRSEDEALKFLEKQSDKGLALVHNLLYGATVDRLHVARDARIAEIRKTLPIARVEVKGRQLKVDAIQKDIDYWEHVVKTESDPQYAVAGQHRFKTKKQLAGSKAVIEDAQKRLEKLYKRREKAQALVDEAQKRVDENGPERANTVSRLTLVSDGMLTQQRWDGLKAAIGDLSKYDVNDKAQMDVLSRIVDDAIDQYDVLRANFNGASWGPLERANWVIETVTKIEESQGGLVRLLPDDVEQELRAAVNGAHAKGRYELGIAPDHDKRWGMVHATDGSGRIDVVNTFVDSIPSFQTAARVDSTFNRAQTFTSKWFSGIRGQRIYFEARQKFAVEAVKNYGIHRTDAHKLFDALRAESFRRGIGTRAFRTSDILDIAKSVNVQMEPRYAASIGVNGLLDLLVRSWEGNLMTVGAAPKLAGKIKRIGVKRTDNLIGRISEDLYVKSRFLLSPMFLFMETTEGPFFALLRGIKPGWKWTADEVRANSVMSHLFGKETAAEQLDRAQRWALNGQVSVRVAGPQTRLARGLDRAFGFWKKDKGGGRFADTRVQGLHEWKELLYVRQWLKDSSEEWVANMRKYAPQEYETWVKAAGSSDPRKMFLAYMEDRKMYDPNARHGLHLLDASRPTSIGAREHIRVGDVAAFHNFNTVEEMRAALHSGDLSEEGFVKRYTDLGLNEAYARRAYKTVSGKSEKQWLGHFEQKFPDPVERDTLIRGIRWAAHRKRMSFEDFLNEGVLEIHDPIASAKDLPANPEILRQSIESTIRSAYGDAFYHGAASPKFARVRSVMTDLLPKFDTNDKGKAKGMTHLRARARVEEGRGFAPPPHGPLAETAHHASVEGRIVPGSPEDLKHLIESGHFSNMLARMEGGFGGDVNALLSAADWYNEIPTMFIAIGETMNEGIVNRIWGEWSAANPEAAAKVLERVDESVDPSSPHYVSRETAIREEISARLCLAFYATQQNTSVADGMRMLTGWMSSLQNGWYIPEGAAEKGALEGIILRLNALVRNMEGMTHEGTGPKLSDFMDSGVGKLRRSLTEWQSDPFQPAAMDVWMYRILGYPDRTYVQRLTMDRLRREMVRKADKDPEYRNSPNAARHDEYVRDMAVLSDNSPDGTYMMEGWGKPKSPEYLKDAEGNFLLDENGKRMRGPTPPRPERTQSAEIHKTLVEYGWDRMKEIPESHDAPKEMQYEFMLMRTNQWVEYLNKFDGEGAPYRAVERMAKGMDPRWTAREVQALLWVGEQKYLRYPGTDPVAAFVHSSAEFAIEPTSPAAFGVYSGKASFGSDGPWAVIRPEDVANVKRAAELEALAARKAKSTAAKSKAEAIALTAEAKALRASSQLMHRYPQRADMVTYFSSPKNVMSLDTNITQAIPHYIQTAMESADPEVRKRAERAQAEWVSEQIVAIVGEEAFDAIMVDVTNATGTITVAQQVNIGTWDQGGVDMSSRTTVPNRSVMVWGSPDARQGAALMVGRALRQDVVYGISRPGDTVMRPSKNRPIIYNEAVKGKPTKWQATASLPEDAEVARIGKLVGLSKNELATLLSRALGNDVLGRIEEGTYSRAEYPGSMARTLDTGHTAVAFTWDNSQSPRWAKTVDDAGKRAEEVARRDLEAERVLTEKGFPPARDKNGRTPAEKALERSKRAFTKSKTSSEWAAELGVFDTDLRRKYEDGTWLREIMQDPEAPLMPIKFGHELVVEEYIRVADHEIGRRNIVGPEGATPEQHLVHVAEAATRRVDEAFTRVAPGLFAEHRNRVATLTAGSEQPPFIYGAHRPAGRGGAAAGDGARARSLARAADEPTIGADGGALHQRNESNRHVRAAYIPGDDGAGTVYTVRGRSDASSVVHELFHHHLSDVDPSMLSRMADVWSRATGESIPAWSGTRLPKVVEEWWAAQFERFAAQPDKWGETNPTYYHTFKNFSDWAQSEPRLMREVEAPVAELLDRVLDPLRDVPPAMFDPDSNRLWQATRTAFHKAEEQAHKTVYYSQSRSLAERSLNHPYLGLYPASYMWGKVLPELIRFMTKQPFGYKAPLLGAGMVGHVWRNVQYRLATDEGLNDFIDEHPSLVNFMTLMVPGTPFELPVNTPLYIRRGVEAQQTAAYKSKLTGKEVKPDTNYLSWLGDMIGYAQGPVQTFNRLGDIAEEFKPEDLSTGEMNPSDYLSGF